MSKVCFISNCRVKSDDPGCLKFHFFRVPKSEETRKKWSDSIQNFFNKDVNFKKHSYVCERHFEKHCFNYGPMGINLMLKRGCCPTIFDNYDLRESQSLEQEKSMPQNLYDVRLKDDKESKESPLVSETQNALITCNPVHNQEKNMPQIYIVNIKEEIYIPEDSHTVSNISASALDVYSSNMYEQCHKIQNMPQIIVTTKGEIDVPVNTPAVSISTANSSGGYSSYVYDQCQQEENMPQKYSAIINEEGMIVRSLLNFKSVGNTSVSYNPDIYEQENQQRSTLEVYDVRIKEEIDVPLDSSIISESTIESSKCSSDLYVQYHQEENMPQIYSGEIKEEIDVPLDSSIVSELTIKSSKYKSDLYEQCHQVENMPQIYSGEIKEEIDVPLDSSIISELTIKSSKHNSVSYEHCHQEENMPQIYSGEIKEEIDVPLDSSIISELTIKSNKYNSDSYEHCHQEENMPQIYSGEIKEEIDVPLDSSIVSELTIKSSKYKSDSYEQYHQEENMPQIYIREINEETDLTDITPNALETCHSDVYKQDDQNESMPQIYDIRTKEDIDTSADSSRVLESSANAWGTCNTDLQNNLQERKMKLCFLCNTNGTVLEFTDDSFKKCYFILLFCREKKTKYSDIQLTRESIIKYGYHETCYNKFTVLKQKLKEEFDLFYKTQTRAMDPDQKSIPSLDQPSLPKRRKLLSYGKPSNLIMATTESKPTPSASYTQPLKNNPSVSNRVQATRVENSLLAGEMISFKNITGEEEIVQVLSSEEENSGDEDNFILEICSSESEDEDDELDRNAIQPAQDTKLPTDSPQSTSFVWNNTLNVTPDRIPFTGKRQLKILPDGDSPTAYFRSLLTDEFIDEIVRESNKYAATLLLAKKSPKSRIASWKQPLTREEFLVFLGLTFHTGTIRMPRLTDYWSSKGYRRGLMQVPCFSEIMTRDRYLLILQVLHFASNPLPSEPKPTDKLYKIKPVINYFNNRMTEVFSPGRELHIGESMVLWTGLSFRQYSPNEHKRDIKLYMLTESTGLALKLALNAKSADKGENHTEKVVESLIQGQTGKGHSLLMDSSFNSVPLTKKLLDQKTYTTGTLQQNRRFNPMDVMNKKLKKGEMTHQMTTDGICVMKWRDKKDILMISSETRGDLIDVIKRSRNQEVVTRKPAMFLSYNKWMGGIDQTNRPDQLLSYNPYPRKSSKWYKKLAIHIFQIILNNSFFAFNAFSGKKRTLYDFRLDIIEALVYTDYPNRPISKISRPLSSSLLSHFPQPVEKIEGRAGLPQLQCRLCWRTSKIKVKTRYYCKGCTEGDSRVALCLKCFESWHSSLL